VGFHLALHLEETSDVGNIGMGGIEVNSLSTILMDIANPSSTVIRNPNIC
jgi:hypothetical protein